MGTVTVRAKRSRSRERLSAFGTGQDAVAVARPAAPIACRCSACSCHSLPFNRWVSEATIPGGWRRACEWLEWRPHARQLVPVGVFRNVGEIVIDTEDRTSSAGRMIVRHARQIASSAARPSKFSQMRTTSSSSLFCAASRSLMVTLTTPACTLNSLVGPDQRGSLPQRRV